jgi:tetratricopeptide (TPR) repeat protein
VTVKGRAWPLVVALFLTITPSALSFPQDEPVSVEPAELEQRKDLIGKAVVIDDHVEYYVTRSGSDPDELQLKRTRITFLVPRRLRPSPSIRMTSAIVRGALRQAGGRLVCDVTDLRAVPKDLERLERGLAGLPAKDFETRKAWARWAQRRAAAFGDKALRDRALALEGDALRIESEMKRVGVDAPREWLAMAMDARRREIPEPEPSALAHRAFQSKLAATTGAVELKGLIEEIVSFFPGTDSDRDSGRVNLARWEKPYAADPAAAYRLATPQVRKALDRRLWATATERFLTLQAAQDLAAAVTVAERMASVLPEKPELSAQLLASAVQRSRQALGTLRLAEVKTLASLYREKLAQPDEASKTLREWLKIQQDRLSSTDAEGRLLLANLYEELLQDHVTCVELLRKAWRIDPTSQVIAEAFRSRGFRKVKDEWVEASAPGDAASANAPGRAPSGARDLRNLTPDEVRLSLGEPKYVNRVGSKGQLMEQWIFVDTRAVRFVNIVRVPGELRPRVIADYSVPPTDLKGGIRSSR